MLLCSRNSSRPQNTVVNKSEKNIVPVGERRREDRKQMSKVWFSCGRVMDIVKQRGDWERERVCMYVCTCVIQGSILVGLNFKVIRNIWLRPHFKDLKSWESKPCRYMDECWHEEELQAVRTLSYFFLSCICKSKLAIQSTHLLIRYAILTIRRTFLPQEICILVCRKFPATQ